MGFAVSVALVVIGLTFFWSSFSLPNPQFDPVGPSGLPKIASFVLVVLCLGVAAAELSSIRMMLRDRMDVLPRITGNIWPAVAFGLTVIVYVGALTWLTLGFAPITFVFLYASGLILAPINRRTVPGLAVLAAVVSFGSDYVFSSVLTLVLPGAG